jgi:hypothetical protein
MTIAISLTLATSAMATTEIDSVKALVGTGMFGAGAAATIQAQRYYNTLDRQQVTLIQQWTIWREKESDYIRRIRSALAKAGIYDDVLHRYIGMTHHTTFTEALGKARRLAESTMVKDSAQYRNLMDQLIEMESEFREKAGAKLDVYMTMSAEAAHFNNNMRPTGSRLRVSMPVSERNFGRGLRASAEQAGPTVRGARFLRGAGVAGMVVGGFVLGTSLEDDVNSDYRGTPQYRTPVPVEQAAAED